MSRYLYKNFYFIFILDIVFVAFSWYFSHLLRFNFSLTPDTIYFIKRILPLIIIIKITVFYLFDLYRGMWRYTSLTDLVDILKAGSIASLIILFLIFFVQGFGGFSRSIFIIDWGLTLFFIAGSRVAIRLYFWLGVGDESARFMGAGFFPSMIKNNRPGKKLLFFNDKEQSSREKAIDYRGRGQR